MSVSCILWVHVSFRLIKIPVPPVTISFFRDCKESNAMRWRSSHWSPILLNMQKRSGGLREKKWRGREGGVRIRGKVDERLRGGGEMRPGEGKVE